MTATINLPREVADVVATDIAASSAGARRPAGSRRWTRRELLMWWRERNHRDPAGDARLDWADDVERVAIAQHVLSWNTPDEVASMIAIDSSRAAIADLWAAMQPHDRQLYRRRAALLLGVADQVTR